MLRFLADRPGFVHVPRLAGWAEYAGQGETATVALLQQFVANTGDGWTHMLARLGDLCERLAAATIPPTWRSAWPRWASRRWPRATSWGR